MKKLKTRSVCWVTLIFFMPGFLGQPAMAVTGDVNGDGRAYMPDDVTYLFVYLFENGPPPPNPIDAELDLTAGINLGDMLQLVGVIQGDCLHYPGPFTGVGPSFSNIEFTFPVITPGSGMEPFDLTLDLTDNPGPDLMGMVITFNYQHQPGHVGVILDSVDFTGSIVPAEWETQAYIDSVNKRALLLLSAPGDYLPLSSGTTGLIATLTFTRTENPSGDATFLSPTVFPPTHSPILITDYCAPAPSDRIVIPKYVFGKNGDVNCDGKVDSGDIVYLINYLFLGGPPPCVW